MQTPALLGHEAAQGLSPGSRTDVPQPGPQSLLAKLGITPKLSEPIDPASIVPGAAYVMVDAKGRLLCGPASGWNWAWFGKYEDWSSNILSVCFTSDPTVGATTITLGGRSDVYLRTNGNSTNWNWAFWGDNIWKGFAAMNMTAVASGNGYQLKYVNGTTDMYLCAATSSSWDYAYIGGDSWTPTTVTLHKFYLTWDDLKTLIEATWPTAAMDKCSLRTSDAKYELLTDSVATTIYKASGLSGYTYKADVFDCDDFATVYRAQAAKYAWSQSVTAPYAIGMISGEANLTDPRHAANIFFDINGNVKVLEPQGGLQGGKIVLGSQWQDNNGTTYIPDRVVF